MSQCYPSYPISAGPEYSNIAETKKKNLKEPVWMKEVLKEEMDKYSEK